LRTTPRWLKQKELGVLATPRSSYERLPAEEAKRSKDLKKEEMMQPNFAVKYAVTQWCAFVHLSLAPWSFWYMNHHWDKTRLP